MVEIYSENRYGYTIIYEILDNCLVIKALGISTYRFGNNFIDPEGGPFICENFKIPHGDKNYIITKILHYDEKRLNNRINLTISCDYREENI